MKNKLSKLCIVMLTGSLMASLVGCGNSVSGGNASETDNDKLSDNDVDESDTEGDTDSDNGKTDEYSSSLSADKQSDLRKATTGFSVEAFKNIYASDGGNVLISPLSIELAFGMAVNGAGGETYSQMMEVLANGEQLDDYNEYMRSLNASNNVLSLANSIWVRDSGDTFEVSQEFIDKNEDVFAAETYYKPFDSTTADEVNKWVADKTHDMITKLVDELDPSEVMLLINAAAFEGKWEETYGDSDIYENMEFNCKNGSKANVTMLSSTEHVYIEGDDVTGFVKDYAGGRYAFMALLPDEETSIDDFISSLDAQKFTELYESRQNKKVYAMIPEFSYDYTILLNDILQSMGMKDAFTPVADFAKMGNEGADDLYIATALHKTYISLDRNGTKAAAVTEIAVTKNSVEYEEEILRVYLDRPFVYIIMDKDSQVPVFIGTVCNL